MKEIAMKKEFIGKLLPYAPVIMGGLIKELLQNYKRLQNKSTKNLTFLMRTFYLFVTQD